MARSAYNYTLAETHKGKVYIPYVGIEVKGYTTLFSAVLGFFTVTAVIGFPLSFIFGSVSYFIAAALAVCAVVTAVIYSNEINNETGRTKLKEFYYLNIKKYRYVYESKGIKRYIRPKTKGAVYVNVCRNSTRIR